MQSLVHRLGPGVFAVPAADVCLLPAAAAPVLVDVCHPSTNNPMQAARMAAPRGRRSGPFALLFAALFTLSQPATAQQIERVSVDAAGVEGDAASVASVLSGDGQSSAFSSYATNLVAGDTNGFRDVFVRDATTQVTVRVSISPTGMQADGASYSPSLAANGRYLAFTSAATNLVPGDTNAVTDVFVHDRDPDGNGIFDEGNGVNRRVSVDSSGLEALGGSYGAYSHTISDDGRLVVFRSDASNLIAGDGNGASDVFVHDLFSGLTTRVSVDSAGAEANLGSSLATISGDGAVVAFHSDASNLVPGDSNGVTDVFTHDLLSGLTTRVSVDSSGQQFSGACSAPALSSDGGVIAFRRRSVFYGVVVFALHVHDRATGSTQQISGSFYSYSNWWSHQSYSSWATALGFAALSADGNRVAYMTTIGSSYTYTGWPASSFYADATASLLVFDRSSQVTRVLTTYSSTNFSTEAQALAWAPFYAPALSDDGCRLAFESTSPSLVAGDTNGVRDAFVLTATGSYEQIGTGCVNSTGNIAGNAMTGGTLPSYGQPMSFTIDNAPANELLSLMMLGFVNVGGIDLGTIGMPGCLLHTDLVLLLLASTDAAGIGVTAPFSIPNDPALFGAFVLTQPLIKDTGTNAFGAVTGVARKATIGCP